MEKTTRNILPIRCALSTGLGSWSVTSQSEAAAGEAGAMCACALHASSGPASAGRGEGTSLDVVACALHACSAAVFFSCPACRVSLIAVAAHNYVLLCLATPIRRWRR